MCDAVRVGTVASLHWIPSSNHRYVFHRDHRKNSHILSFNLKLNQVLTPGSDETDCEIHSERLF